MTRWSGDCGPDHAVSRVTADERIETAAPATKMATECAIIEVRNVKSPLLIFTGDSLSIENGLAVTCLCFVLVLFFTNSELFDEIRIIQC